MLNETLLDRFKVDRLVGEGGMGLVYAGHDLQSGDSVAIKTLHSEFAARPDFSGRFMREAKTHGLLDHPNIAELHTVGARPDGTLFIVMEFVDGEELADWIGRDDLRPVDIIDICVQVFSALHYASQFDVVHRDIKPENVMISARDIAGTRLWVVKLIDFGLVKVLSSVLGEKEAQRLTKTGAVFGTPQYMAPEQASGVGVDVRTDIYAVGVMFFELLTGVAPYLAEDPTDVLRMHLHSPLPRLGRVRGVNDESLREVLEGFVHRCMAKDPNDRFQTPAEASARLRELRPLVAG
jgi:serine/threonine-protein kinase